MNKQQQREARKKIAKILKSLSPTAEVRIADGLAGGDRLSVNYLGKTTTIRLNSNGVNNSRNS